ncbi:hypothetical protein Ccar_25720 [Clostridium carboxidivorans P7]|uniref:DUF2953 domain-containing protein n=1 Tax=Clostridium carboxidivorans P7 TaxID=536227 RepID=C6PQP3_9CLOT|nr:DUF2953 domain-containing protein [Clostridium carboxidivorans]AKN34049.1 hypothetical protein Ccar_25720 [Clostridium carboxidivorans P7]EET88415.1 conserved hypothetical protein [Clostridium carboxidivorans P7]EFG88077.1 hypothetical protein CLCAR_2065 [Clostridium carboxidivorans P7]
MLIIFSIIILILLIPIPITFKIKYTDKKLCMYIYNIELISKFKSYKKEDENKNKDKSNFYFENIRLFLDLLNRNKFKPTLRFKLNFQYGLNDAAYTAICYGLFCALFPLVIKLLNYPFKIKKHSICIVPDLKKFILKLELNSIIFVNFAKVIYIIYIIYRVWRINQKIILSKT